MGSPELPLPKRSKEHIKHAIANSGRMRNLTFRAKENFSAKENFLTEGFALSEFAPGEPNTMLARLPQAMQARISATTS